MAVVVPAVMRAVSVEDVRQLEVILDRHEVRQLCGKADDLAGRVEAV